MMGGRPPSRTMPGRRLGSTARLHNAYAMHRCVSRSAAFPMATCKQMSAFLFV